MDLQRPETHLDDILGRGQSVRLVEANQYNQWERDNKYKSHALIMQLNYQGLLDGRLNIGLDDLC